MRHLICFGNDLHGDDGFGLAVYRRLQATALPPDTRLFAAATRGLDALALFEGCDEAVLVDAMASLGEPGRLHWLAPDDVLPETGPNLPGHGAGVGHLLQCLALLDGPPPRLRLLAAEAGRVTPFRPGLSAPVDAAVERAVAELVDVKPLPLEGGGVGVRVEKNGRAATKPALLRYARTPLPIPPPQGGREIPCHRQRAVGLGAPRRTVSR